MTTEDDFHAALDARPEDWQTRLVFADWLDERGDPRAEGYRALGMRGHLPIQDAHREEWNWFDAQEYPGQGFGSPESDLTCDWFRKLDGGEKYPVRASTYHWCVSYPTRREAEDAAALAFANLPAPRRAELLAGVSA